MSQAEEDLDAVDSQDEDKYYSPGAGHEPSNDVFPMAVADRSCSENEEETILPPRSSDFEFIDTESDSKYYSETGSNDNKDEESEITHFCKKKLKNRENGVFSENFVLINDLTDKNRKRSKNEPKKMISVSKRDNLICEKKENPFFAPILEISHLQNLEWQWVQQFDRINQMFLGSAARDSCKRRVNAEIFYRALSDFRGGNDVVLKVFFEFML